MAVTELAITYGSTLAPGGFHRVTDKAHHAANINPAQGGTAVYLWTKRDSGAGITDVCVVEEAKHAPEGYAVLSKDIAKGCAAPRYLAYTTQDGADTGAGDARGGVIGSLVVQYTEEAPGAVAGARCCCCCRTAHVTSLLARL